MKYPCDVPRPQYPTPTPADTDEAFRAYDREQSRIGHWHLTYNAALNAIYVRGNDTAADCHRMAVEAANQAHGEL